MATDIFSRYAEFYNSLTPESVKQLRELAVPDLHFRDPFNDLYTVDGTIRLLEEMFVDTVDPHFVVTHIGRCETSGAPETAFLRWDFSFRPRTPLLKAKGEPWRIVGVSEVTANAEGKIVEHIDHWDSGRYFYERLPLLGLAIRFVRRRLASS